MSSGAAAHAARHPPAAAVTTAAAAAHWDHGGAQSTGGQGYKGGGAHQVSGVLAAETAAESGSEESDTLGSRRDLRAQGPALPGAHWLWLTTAAGVFLHRFRRHYITSRCGLLHDMVLCRQSSTEMRSRQCLGPPGWSYIAAESEHVNLSQ